MKHYESWDLKGMTTIGLCPWLPWILLLKEIDEGYDRKKLK